MKDMEAPGRSPNYEMRYNIKYHTVNCVVCFEKASQWTGHIIRGNTHIIAGWCNNHNYEVYLRKSPCYGEFKEEMGLQQLM